MGDLLEKIVELKKSGEPAAFAIVIKIEGSTPRKVGAKMGTVGPVYSEESECQGPKPL